jgi:hypothetical protein
MISSVHQDGLLQDWRQLRACTMLAAAWQARVHADKLCCHQLTSSAATSCCQALLAASSFSSVATHRLGYMLTSSWGNRMFWCQNKHSCCTSA